MSEKLLSFIGGFAVALCIFGLIFPITRLGRLNETINKISRGVNGDSAIVAWPNATIEIKHWTDPRKELEKREE